MNSIDLSEKVTYFLVSGASKGIGKRVAIECAKLLKPGSVVVLLARSASGLEDTKAKILAENQSITIITASVDLSNITKDVISDVIRKSLANVDPSIFGLAFIVHNIGTLGDSSKKASELENNEILQSYFAINVFSVIQLNTCFMETFAQTKKLVVNITSKAAIAPFKSFGYYCPGKAAREMFFRVLAEEEPETVVLNYSPGTVDTDMVAEVQANTHDSDIRNFFTGLKEKKEFLTPLQTTLKMIDVLAKGQFKSGDHIDYFD